MRIKSVIKWTENRIQAFMWMWLMRKGYIFVIPNSKLFGWEADMIGVSPSEKIYEFEIKTTLTDLKREFRRTKKKKHEILLSTKPRRKGRPNYYVIVAPATVINEKDIPKYAGLIWVSKDGTVEERRRPQPIHMRGITRSQYHRLAKAIVWKLWDYVFAPEGWEYKPGQKKRKRSKTLI